MRETINKSDWLIARECLALGWFTLRVDPLAPNEAAQFRMEQGQRVGIRARELFPDGILVSRTNEKTASAITIELLADSGIKTLFEAAFRVEPFAAKVDILKRDGTGWHVLEVKSSFQSAGKVEELINDLAYTVFVVRRAGQQVAKASLVLLSRAFRYGGQSNELFEIVDKTADVDDRVADYERTADAIARAMSEATRPVPRLVPVCRNCDFFHDRCIGSGIERTVFEIPGLHANKLKKLSEAGIINLSHIPDELGLNATQDRAKRASLSGNLTIESGLRKVLASVEWPCHYLDFETVATVLPLYEGHACHRQVLTQFSVHHRASADSETTHSEYLADASKDCERELAGALIEALGDRGSVVVYSNFEKTRIEALRDAFGDLAEPLQAILDRLRDLHPIIENYIYHPNFMGSFSIKKVLPALVPGLSYDDLDVADGDTAITRFARMAKGEITGDAVKTTRKQLLNYCERDTLAMVRLHEALCQLADQEKTVG